mmetsp:Transcript_53956/g.108367  ORF Transcript_53956/g.108367 Transcript_53956/m.108367 type:complete len:89 (+) Transcript_53956:77-343(+)
MAADVRGVDGRADRCVSPIGPSKERRKKKVEEKLRSDFWLSCAGYTVMGLMCVTVALALRLVFHIGEMGYHNRDAIYNFASLGRGEEL